MLAAALVIAASVLPACTSAAPQQGMEPGGDGPDPTGTSPASEADTTREPVADTELLRHDLRGPSGGAHAVGRADAVDEPSGFHEVEPYLRYADAHRPERSRPDDHQPGADPAGPVELGSVAARRRTRHLFQCVAHGVDIGEFDPAFLIGQPSGPTGQRCRRAAGRRALLHVDDADEVPIADIRQPQPLDRSAHLADQQLDELTPRVRPILHHPGRLLGRHLDEPEEPGHHAPAFNFTLVAPTSSSGTRPE